MAVPKKSERSRWEVGLWSRLEEWAAELDINFEDALEGAGVARPSEGARASVWRAQKGGAPRVRAQVYDYLVRMESEAPKPTKKGAVVMGVAEWRDIGESLAMANPEKFLAVLQTLRQALADTTGRPVVGARPTKPATRAISKARLDGIPDVARASDETSGEVAARKKR